MLSSIPDEIKMEILKYDVTDTTQQALEIDNNAIVSEIQLIDPSFSVTKILERLLKNKAILDKAKPSWRTLHTLMGEGIFIRIIDDHLYVECGTDLMKESIGWQVTGDGCGYEIATGDETQEIFKALVVMYDIQADLDLHIACQDYQH